MKQISEQLRNRLKTEDPNPQLILDLLDETDPSEYCAHDWKQVEGKQVVRCCILGRIAHEIEVPVFDNRIDEDFRTLKGKLGYTKSLASINNGDIDEEDDDTSGEAIVSRIRKAMQDLIQKEKK